MATTPVQYAAQASRFLKNMIPECLETYGPPAEKWFTTTGPMVYKYVAWNVETGKTSSSKSADAEKLVNEMDIFGMGTEWKVQEDTTEQPEQRSKEPTTGNKEPNIRNIVENRAKDDDVKSLGLIFNRNKDADTIKEGEEEDARAELVRRLQEYERFKQAAEDIEEFLKRKKAKP